MNLITKVFVMIALVLGISSNVGAEYRNGTDPLGDFIYQLSHSQTKARVEWVMDTVNYNPKKPRITSAQATSIVVAAQKAGEKHGVDPDLLLAIIKKESMFNTKARSSYGAVGLMQVVPRWHRARIGGRNLQSATVNIDVGAHYLAELMAKYKGNHRKALKIYSGSARGYGDYVMMARAQMLSALKTRYS